MKELALEPSLVLTGPEHGPKPRDSLACSGPQGFAIWEGPAFAGDFFLQIGREWGGVEIGDDSNSLHLFSSVQFSSSVVSDSSHLLCALFLLL